MIPKKKLAQLNLKKSTPNIGFDLWKLLDDPHFLKNFIGFISALKDTGSHRNLETGPHQFSAFFFFH
jgi:hypothetical protein